ncbi:MAG TPA: AI-2E family transporter [Terriglobales bacterium]|nr:AI-2E family transporter [Terriglobales bacterium]
MTVNKVDAPEEFLCELSGLLPQRAQRDTAKDAKNGKTIRFQVVRRDYHRCQGRHLTRVDFWDHFRVTGGALKNWLVAQLEDSLAVGLLWLIGLLIIGVPWAPFWAMLGAAFQFVPQIGAVLGVVGPALTAMFKWGDWEHPIYVLILYAVIAIVDGFLLQPYLMKRTARVPVWASILAPIVLGIVIPFWGVLLAPPLLAVLYAYKARQARVQGPML